LEYTTTTTPILPPLPDKTALLVIDVQYYCAHRGEGMLHESRHRGDDYFYNRIEGVMISNITRLLQGCRSRGNQESYSSYDNKHNTGLKADEVIVMMMNWWWQVWR